MLSVHRRWLLDLATGLCLAIVALPLCCWTLQAEGREGATFFPSIFEDKSVFLNAIKREKPKPIPNIQLSGVTVPHHMLAVDLIARGFWAASRTNVKRVIVISPDHFRASKRPFATTTKSFQTVFGPVFSDVGIIRKLLSYKDHFDDSQLFQREHGISAITPFVARFFPHARIIPIAISVDSSAANWELVASLLKPLMGDGTLVIQSTDFSHYLPSLTARQRDQETLNVLGVGAPEGINPLRPSDHLDSKAAQYIQMRLQRDAGAVGPIIIGNRSSVEYGGSSHSTTSYTVQVFGRNLQARQLPRYSDQTVIYFGGDVLLGRYFTKYLGEHRIRRELVSHVKRVTGGYPLIVNFEGVLLDELPIGLTGSEHVSHAGLASSLLSELHVVAVSLANNHAFDMGKGGLEETRRLLSRSGIRTIEQGELLDFGAFRLVGLNFISKQQLRNFPLTDQATIEHLCKSAGKPPLLAFVHWGEEYSKNSSDQELEIASQLEDCGVAAVIGAHSHKASQLQSSRSGAQQIVFSLGNLLFDQNRQKASGALLEVRIFQQGTFATRLIDIANLFDVAKALAGPTYEAGGTSSGYKKGN